MSVNMKEESGRELIRQALFARNRKHNLANLARDLGVPGSTIDTFVFGTAGLAPELLDRLADYVWGMKYDATSDRVVPARRDPPTTFEPPPRSRIGRCRNFPSGLHRRN